MIEFNARESYKVFCALLIDSRENLGLRTLQIRSYSFQSAIIYPLHLPFDLNTLYTNFVQVITAKCESTSGVCKRVSQLQTSPSWLQTKISLSSVRVVRLQPLFPECCQQRHFGKAFHQCDFFILIFMPLLSHISRIRYLKI